MHKAPQVPFSSAALAARSPETLFADFFGQGRAKEEGRRHWPEQRRASAHACQPLALRAGPSELLAAHCGRGAVDGVDSMVSTTWMLEIGAREGGPRYFFELSLLPTLTVAQVFGRLSEIWFEPP